MNSNSFSTGFMTMNASGKGELFLSITPGLEYGPGIQRDGVTPPRMTDPQCVGYLCANRKLGPSPLRTFSTDGDRQRLGTCSIYHHLKWFIEAKPNWQVVAVQSNGDLTMNPWHVAYLAESHITNQIPGNQNGILCGLFTNGDPQEPIGGRTYRSLVKWRESAVKHNGNIRYDFVPLRFATINNTLQVIIAENSYEGGWLTKVGRRPTDDISDLIAFALSGKTIVKQGFPIPLSRAVDKFDDVRHIFNLPVKTPASGNYQKVTINELNLGEYQLYRNLNERRAALFAPVIVDLEIREGGDRVTVDQNIAVDYLEKVARCRPEIGQPTNPDRFRVYPDDEDKLEVFFAQAVYPFGALGINVSHEDLTQREIVAFTSGGLSGQVGNTLEGVIHTMYHYLKCQEAMVLDEGMDCCLIVNPENEKGGYKYPNDELLKRVLAFTGPLAKKSSLLKDPLNQSLDDDVRDYNQIASNPPDYSDIFLVKPHRPQLRSVIIFAVPKERSE